MRGIKTFSIRYKEGGSEQVREWPGQTAEHALKRFHRARELNKRKDKAQLISVEEVRPALPS